MKPAIEYPGLTKEKLELVLRNQVQVGLPPLKQEAFSIDYLLSLFEEGLQEIWLGQRTILANLEKEMLPILRECDLTRGRCELIRLLVAHRAQIRAAGGRRIQNVTPAEHTPKVHMPSPAEIGLFELWPRYHTTANAARLAGIDRDTLHRWLHKGLVAGSMTRRGTRFFWTDAEVNRLKHDIEWMRKGNATKSFVGTAKPKELAPSKLKVGQPLKPYRNRQLERAKAEVAAEIERHTPKNDPPAEVQPVFREEQINLPVTPSNERLVSRETACEMLGLLSSTVSRWISRGQLALPAGPTLAGRDLWSPQDIERLRLFAKRRPSHRLPAALRHEAGSDE